MRIAEFFTGFGKGGAERAAATRLGLSLPGVASVVSVSGAIKPGALVRTPVDVEMVRCPSRNELPRWLKSEGYDAVLAHSPREALRLLSDRRIADSVPVIPVAHSTRPFVSPLGRVVVPPAMRVLNHRAAGHIAVSQEAAAGPWCQGSPKVLVCHLGATTLASTLRTSTDDQGWPASSSIRALSLGRLVPSKGIHVLLDAMSRAAQDLRGAGFHLVVAGDGPSRPRLERRVSRLRIMDLVTFLGEADDPSELLAGADVLIVSSMHEGGPLTVSEALAVGTPVLTTPVGATLDFNLSQHRLRYLSGFSVKDIYEGLANLIHAPLRRSSGPPTSHGPWNPRWAAGSFYTAVGELSGVRWHDTG